MALILIIEDEKHVRENLEEILLEEGFQVLAAKDGEEGLSILRYNTPDLIICDVMMPKVDGYSVLEKLRSDSKYDEIPFLFLSALSSELEVRKGMNLSADDYITKPYKKKDLLDSIAIRLERRKKLDNYIGVKISEVQKELESIQTQKRFLATILSISPDGILIFDLNLNKIVFHNDEFLIILLKIDERFSLQMNNLESSTVLIEVIDIIKSVELDEFENDDGNFIEKEFKLESAKEFWISLRVSIFKKDNLGNSAQYLIVMRDITEKKKKEFIIEDFYQKVSTELIFARETQKSMIPRKFPSGRGVFFYSYYEPIEKVGGDFLTYKELSDDIVDFFIGDVSGHGISAAMVSTMSVLNFTLLEHSNLSPREALHSIHNSLSFVSKIHHIVAVYLRFNKRTRKLQYSYAGHPPGFVIRNNEIYDIPGKGNPLLLLPEPVFRDFAMDLEKHDRLVFYSDGLFEVTDSNEVQLGLEEFKNIILDKARSYTGEEFVKETVDSVLKYCDYQTTDDMMLFTIECDILPPLPPLQN